MSFVLDYGTRRSHSGVSGLCLLTLPRSMRMHCEPRIASAVYADDKWSRRGQAVGKRSCGVNHDFYAMHPIPIGDRNDIGDRKLGMEVV
jgi:hypothetical protein